MTHDDAVQKVYACARERGAVFAADELEGSSPEPARRVLAAYINEPTGPDDPLHNRVWFVF